MDKYIDNHNLWLFQKMPKNDHQPLQDREAATLAREPPPRTAGHGALGGGPARLEGAKTALETTRNGKKRQE